MDWEQVIDVEAKVATCGECTDRSGNARVSPQPSWIGRDYAAGGVVFVLKNPVDPPDRAAWDRRDDCLTQLLMQFRIKPTVPGYHQFVAEVHAQMQGRDDRTTEAWGTWTDLVNKCVEGCLEPPQLAWVNLVKYRKQRGQNLTGEEREHGRRHLRAELEVLQPGLIVAAGREAERAVIRLGTWGEPAHVPLRNPTFEETLEVANRIRRDQFCRNKPEGKKARKRASRSNRIRPLGPAESRREL